MLRLIALTAILCVSLGHVAAKPLPVGKEFLYSQLSRSSLDNSHELPEEIQSVNMAIEQAFIRLAFR